MASLVQFDGVDIKARLSEAGDLVITAVALARYGDRVITQGIPVDPAEYEAVKTELQAVAAAHRDAAEEAVTAAAYEALTVARQLGEEIRARVEPAEAAPAEPAE